jgi:hypothetical protein
MHAQRSGHAARTRAQLAVVILLPLLIIIGCKQSQTTEPATAPGEAELEGALDEVNGEQIWGWVWDPKRPDTTLTVEIFDGDKKVATAPADQLRKDLVDKKTGNNGKHSFSIATPASLKDGKPHTLRAKVQETGRELPGSPKTLKAP